MSAFQALHLYRLGASALLESPWQTIYYSPEYNYTGQCSKYGKDSKLPSWALVPCFTDGSEPEGISSIAYMLIVSQAAGRGGSLTGAMKNLHMFTVHRTGGVADSAMSRKGSDHCRHRLFRFGCAMPLPPSPSVPTAAVNHVTYRLYRVY